MPKDIEYEYFLFQKQFGNNDDVAKNKSFVDGAWEAVKGKDTIQVMTAGNNWRNNPYHRALYPYFHPEAEGNWISISAIAPKDKETDKYVVLDENYTVGDEGLRQGFNRGGFAKYWTLASGGVNGNSSGVSSEGAVEYGNFGGTSMAAPLVSGAFGVLMSRYPEMTAKQVRDVLFTTANHKNPDGSLIEGWGVLTNEDLEKGNEAVAEKIKAAKEAGAGFKPVLEDGQVDVKIGWGVPDLDVGMYGPKQLLGEMNYSLNGLDVWTNPINEVALKQRQDEDIAWYKKMSSDGTLEGKVQASKGGDYKLQSLQPIKGLTAEQSAIEQAKAEKWRQAYFDARAAMIKEKLAKGLYHGSLVKDGEGTLVLTGVNTYKGGTVVKAGKLYGFAQSFGDASQPAEETPNLGKVVVEGGTFGITPVYVDQLTLKGRINGADKLDGKAAITVKAPGTLDVLVSKTALEAGAGETTKVQSLTLEDGATVRLSSLDWADSVPEAGELKGDKAVEFRAKNPQEAAVDLVEAVVNSEKADFKIEGKIQSADAIKGDTAKLKGVDYLKAKQTLKIEGNNLTVTLAKKSEEETKKTIEGMNLSDNQAKILDTFAKELKLDSQTIDEVQQTTKMASEDSLVNAQSAVLMNTTRLTQTIRDQAIGFMAVKPTTSEGNVWGTLVGSTGKVKLGLADTKADYANALVGGDYAVTPQVKVGAFLGAGHGKLKADGFAKTKTTDIHAGVYAHGKVENLGEFTGGFLYTHQKRDIEHVLLGDHKFNTNITSLFAEAACPGFNLAKVTLQPYVGLDWTHFEGKTIKFDEDFSTSIESQNVFASALGARASLPFSVGTWSMSAKADVAWKHFFGSKPSWSLMAEKKAAKLEGEKLSNMGTIGLGVDAQVMKTGTLGLSYQGAFANDAHSHGVMMNFKYQF